MKNVDKAQLDTDYFGYDNRRVRQKNVKFSQHEEHVKESEVDLRLK